MRIVMNDACTINVSQLYLESSITNINVMPQLGASLTDNSRVIIYDHFMFIIEATVLFTFKRWRKIWPSQGGLQSVFLWLAFGGIKWPSWMKWILICFWHEIYTDHGQFAWVDWGDTQPHTVVHRTLKEQNNTIFFNFLIRIFYQVLFCFNPYGWRLDLPWNIRLG